MNATTTTILLLALTAIVSAKEPTSAPAYTNKATVGMTEAESIACYDPELYHSEIQGKGIDRIIRILTNSRGGGVGDGFNIIEGSKPDLYKTIKVSKKTGKVFYVSKGSK